MNILLTSTARDTTTWTNPAEFEGPMPTSGTSYTNTGTQYYQLRMDWLSVPADPVITYPYLLLNVSFLGKEYRGYISNDDNVSRSSFVIPVDVQDTTPNVLLTMANPSSNYITLDKTFKIVVKDNTGTVLDLESDDVVAVHFTATPKPTNSPPFVQSL